MLKIYSLFLEAPDIAMLRCVFASSHDHEKTVKQNVLPSGRTDAKISFTAYLWEALQMKELSNPKAFVDHESLSEMSPRKTGQLAQDKMATHQVSLKRKSNQEIIL